MFCDLMQIVEASGQNGSPLKYSLESAFSVDKFEVI